MFKYDVDIYDLCSGTAKVALQLFCREINNSDADIFVVMAHKAVRLFKLLINQKHICEDIANKAIVSSSALDFEGNYFQGKRIALVDDILISGTTIATAVQKLLLKGVSKDNISIITLATDKKYFRMSFENNGENTLLCNTTLDDADCIELSYTISKIFSYYGISYDIDFPNYNVVELTEDKELLLLNNIFWYTHNISNDNQISGKIDVYSLLPQDCVKAELWTKIKANLDNCVHLKLRAYVKNYPSGKRECYVVPMCLFDEITETDLDRLFEILKPSCGNILIGNHNEHIAKLRYLQFYISHKLFLIFNDITSMGFASSPTIESIDYIFGSDNNSVVSKAINEYPIQKPKYIIIGNGPLDTSKLSNYWNSVEGKSAEKLIKINEKNSESNLLWMNRYIISPFIWWYQTEELPIRESLVKRPCHYINDYSLIKGKLCRLNHGFSFKALQTLMKKIPDNNEYEQYISLFLDRAIDEGFIVPTITHNKNSCCLSRIYRHGEDLPFTLQDECRLLYYLLCLYNKIPDLNYKNSENPDSGIASITFEKMIVLFYQIGLTQNNIFNRFLGFDNIRILKPYLSLHGAISAFVDPKKIKEREIIDHFYSERLPDGDRYITWLSYWLKEKLFINDKPDRSKTDKYDKTVITINKNRIEHYLKRYEKSNTCNVIKQNIENIANMIAIWYNTSTTVYGKLKFKEDAVALTSCSNAYTYASAIATELHYFAKFWTIQAKKAFENSTCGSDFCNSLVATNNDKKYTKNTEQGLYSGCRKVDFYREGRANRVIEEVGALLNSEGISWWTSIWDTIKTAGSSAPKYFRNYTDHAIGLLYFYALCFECVRYKPFWNTGELPKAYEKYKTRYIEHCNNSEWSNLELLTRFDEIAKNPIFEEKKESLNNLINSNLLVIKDLISCIEEVLKTNEQNYTIKYRASLIFEIRALDSSNANSIVMDCWNSLPENLEKTQLNIVRLSDEKSNQGFIRYGFFYGYKKSKNDNAFKDGEFLLKIYDKMCKLFSGQVYEIKAILLPDTTPFKRYTQTTYRSISDNVEKFNSEVVDLLKKIYISECKQQLVVGLNEFVNDSFYNSLAEFDWDKSKNKTAVKNSDLVSRIKVYYNNYILPPTGSVKHPVGYSIVKVECNQRSGAGLIINAGNQILCVSCAHIFKDCPLQTAYAYINTYQPTKIPLTPIKLFDYSTSDSDILLPASQEVAIFELDFNGRIPLDIDAILTIDDISRQTSSYYGQNCRCCGFPGNTQQWSDTFQLIGPVEHGYCQTEVKEKNGVCEGYSGGIIVLNNDYSCIVGIHEGRRPTYESEFGCMIPCDTIVSEIKELNKYE